MKQKVFRSGHSLAVVVPAKFARNIALKAGDEVSVRANSQKGKIVYQFPHNTQLLLAFKNSAK
ncbi:MAG: AbrB/MazE/SpoVT family DNA-binding domain-containing protein [Patescibacteria group bacterium]